MKQILTKKHYFVACDGCTRYMIYGYARLFMIIQDIERKAAGSIINFKKMVIVFLLCMFLPTM